jgi:hypothetical protein
MERVEATIPLTEFKTWGSYQITESNKWSVKPLYSNTVISATCRINLPYTFTFVRMQLHLQLIFYLTTEDGS